MCDVLDRLEEKALKKAEKQFAKEKAVMQKNFAKEIADMKKNHAKELADMKKNFAKEKAVMQKNSAKELADMKKNFAKELAIAEVQESIAKKMLAAGRPRSEVAEFCGLSMDKTERLAKLVATVV